MELLHTKEYRGAFLTSTSRLICPISSIQLMDEGDEIIEFDPKDYTSEFDLLRASVGEEMKQRLLFL